MRLDGKTALVVVAHPDDETIWMGGTILMNPQVQWTILSLCRGDDPDRAPKFRRVCEYYGAKGIISDLEDEGIMNINESVPEIEKRIRVALRQASADARTLAGRQGIQFDYVFTHGANGEYGHPRHKGVAKVVKLLVESCKLRTEKLFIFSYELDEKRGVVIPMAVKSEIRNTKFEINPDVQNLNFKKTLPKNLFISNLIDSVFRRKRDVIEKMYGFKKSSFEYRSASRAEAFRLLGRRN